MFPLPLNIWVEVAAFIISLLCIKALRNKPLQWFIPFLLLVVIVEITGRFLRKEMHVPNSWLYNMFIPVEYFFNTYLFYAYFENIVLKKTAKIILILIPVAALVNMTFVQGFYNFNTNILFAGNCLMIILSCAFFIDLFKREEELVLWREPMFWIATGILLFNLGELSYTLFFDYILKHKQDPRAILFSTINGNLIYLFYTLISIGLLCTRRSLTVNYQKT
ncbi:MAG: hypothetical protein ABIW38_07540 [Ferruginibacter sp.]